MYRTGACRHQSRKQPLVSSSDMWRWTRHIHFSSCTCISPYCPVERYINAACQIRLTNAQPQTKSWEVHLNTRIRTLLHRRPLKHDQSSVNIRAALDTFATGEEVLATTIFAEDGEEERYPALHEKNPQHLTNDWMGSFHSPASAASKHACSREKKI